MLQEVNPDAACLYVHSSFDRYERESTAQHGSARHRTALHCTTLPCYVELSMVRFFVILCTYVRLCTGLIPDVYENKAHHNTARHGTATNGTAQGCAVLR